MKVFYWRIYEINRGNILRECILHCTDGDIIASIMINLIPNHLSNCWFNISKLSSKPLELIEVAKSPIQYMESLVKESGGRMVTEKESLLI